jgi:hypothetical protein
LTYDVVPSDSKRQGRVDESRGKGNVTSGNGEVGDHFTERDHDRVTDGTHKGVSHEKTKGSTVGQGISGTQEKTGSDNTTDTALSAQNLEERGSVTYLIMAR